MDAAWQSAALARIGVRPGATRWTELGGSTFGGTWRLESGDDRYFVKSHLASRLAMLEAEEDGLRDLSRAGAIRVPMPVVCASAGEYAFLALEWLDFGHGGRDAALGSALAQLHRVTADRHGWRRDNTIGATPQDNAW